MVEHVARYSQPGPEGLVFVMPEGTPLRRENLRRRVWYPVVRAAGMDGLRFHDLRNTNATWQPRAERRSGHSWLVSAMHPQPKQLAS